VWSGETPTPKKRNSHVQTVLKAVTPTATVTKGKGQYSAPLVVESPGGTITTSAYNDGKKGTLMRKKGLAIRERRFMNKTKPSRVLFAKEADALV
jgi:hypothetical protein